MEREQILIDIEEIQDKVDLKNFKGQNEYNLFLREEIADYIELQLTIFDTLNNLKNY